MNLIRHWIESFKAWRRGDKRVAPAGVTGRVFERDGVAGKHASIARGRASMRKTVIRKDSGNG